MGANPDPVANTMLNGGLVKIYTASVVNNIELNDQYEVGEILPNSSVKTGVFVKCGSGVIKLGQMQLPGGKVLEATQLLNGRKIKVGDKFEYIVQID